MQEDGRHGSQMQTLQVCEHAKTAVVDFVNCLKTWSFWVGMPDLPCENVRSVCQFCWAPKVQKFNHLLISVFSRSILRYRCHKTCAEKAPHNCGLPRELIDYFRKQVVLTSTPSRSSENYVSTTEAHSTRPRLEKVSTVSEPDSGKEMEFPIQELTKEPTNSE